MHIRFIPLLWLALKLCQSIATAAPIANDDTFSTLEDTPLNITVPGIFGNDTMDGHSDLTAVLITPPDRGGLLLNPDGSFTYHPPLNFSGPQTFTYQLVRELGSTMMQVDSDASILTSTITLETFSVGGTRSTLTTTTRAGGEMQVRLSAHQAPFGMVRVEKLDLSGLDAMSGTLCASRLFGSCLTTVTLGVPANSLKVTMNVPESGQAGPEVPVGPDGVFYQLGNLVNTDGVVNISSVLLAGPTQASLAGTEVPQDFTNSSVSETNGILRVAIPVDIPATFSESGDWASPGDYRAAVRISGIVYATAAAVAPVSSGPATVTLNVTPVDDPPAAFNDQILGLEMATVTIPASAGLLQNDVDIEGDAFTAEILTQPQRGRAVVRADGSLDFTAAPGAPSFSDSFYYRLRQNGQPVLLTQPVLTEGDFWKYHTASAGPVPQNWHSTAASDILWNIGQAPFGYGYAGVATTLSYGQDSQMKTITHYLRKSFQLPVPHTLAAALNLRVRRDDGVAIWLNGVEVARNNLPGTVGDGLLSGSTLALADVQHLAGEFITFTIPAQHLRSGNNLLAVEIHQHSPSSPDLVFNLAADLESYVGAQVQILTNPNDSDADGLADTWEAAHDLNTALNDAAADPDGDGKSNLAEFYAGTHPQYATSQFYAHQITKTTETDLDIHFTPLPGTRYQLQVSPQLSTWADSGPQWTTSPATTIKPAATQLFYRLRAVPPWEP